MFLLKAIRLHLLATQRSNKWLLRCAALLLCFAIMLPLLSGCQAKEEQPPEIDSIRIERELSFRQKYTADVTITDNTQIQEYLDFINNLEFREPEEWEVIYDMDMPGSNFITFYSNGEPVMEYYFYDRFYGIGTDREQMIWENRVEENWPGTWLVMTRECTVEMDALLDRLAPLDPPLDNSN